MIKSEDLVMRSVKLSGYDFQVSDDPHGVLGDFIAVATSSPDYSSEQILDRLQSGGAGYSVQDTMGAFSVETPQDVMDAFGLEEVSISRWGTL